MADSERIGRCKLMLSDKALERVSGSYRRGYRAGYAGEPSQDTMPSTGLGDRPFADFDFNEGYKAGANDAKWTKVNARIAASKAAFGADLSLAAVAARAFEQTNKKAGAQ